MELELRRRLHERTRYAIHDPEIQPAAVLLPLFKFNGLYHILFIERSDTVPHHKSEISFPGGICEKTDDTFERTALREAHEEIGIHPDDVQVIGLLDDMKTFSTGYKITPVVGIIPYPYPFAINQREVEKIITVPLAHFLDAANGGEEAVIREGTIYRGHVFHYGNYVIWGATARILKDFLGHWDEITRDHGGYNYP